METAAQKFKDWWEVADRTQRYVTIFGAAAMLLLLVLTAYVMSRPKMTALYAGLTPEDSGKVVDALRKNGIPVQLGDRGEIMVPSDQKPDAENAVAMAGATPDKGPQGFDLLFNQSGFGQTSKEEQERVIAAKEGELAKTIMTWQGVASAKVHWNPGDDSPFASEKQPGSATVSVVESGAGLAGTAGKAIARLIQNATGVDAEHITVVNNYGRMLYDGELLSNDGFGDGQKLSAEIQESRRREGDLARNLDAAFGPGNTIPMVQVSLNMDKTSIQEETNVPSEAAADTTEVTEAVAGPGVDINKITGNGAGPADVTTAVLQQDGASQNPDTGGPKREGGGAYVSKQKAEKHPTDHKTIVTTVAPGAIAGMTVQILVNKKTVKDIKAVEQIANAYLGANFGKKGFAATVTGIDFDTAAQASTKTAASAAESSAKLQQFISILPVLALLVVGFMVVRAIAKVAAQRNVFTTAALPQGGEMNIQMLQPVKRHAPAPALTDEATRAEYGSPTGEAGQALATALDSGRIDDALKIIEEMPEDPEIKAIQSRINVPLEQIKHMAKTKPESVAMLLKGWIMEDMR
ncbi:MAG TPA: flagellar M-ring protein FliF C-terminal domain-containing protein [Fimbriimonadaceae bacterium]|nr:flagellar M-ring protein FliF C-terminal domain-containing protein [Fimbriimonadaceae bacterium]